MRKRPIDRQNFIDNASGDIAQTSILKDDLHQYVKNTNWPLEKESLQPSLAEGSNLKKPMILPIKEFEWNSIERHTKALGVPKSEWIRYAIYKLMQEEQLFCFKTKRL